MTAFIIRSLCLAIGLGTATSAWAGPPDGLSPQLRIKGAFGLGGEGDVAVKVKGEGSGKESGDFTTTMGLAADLTHPIGRLFALGVSIGFGRWNIEELEDEDVGDHTLLDLDAVLKLGTPIADGSAEIYVMIPVGVSFSFLNDDLQKGLRDASGSDSVRLEDGIGFNVSVLAGIAYRVTEAFGVFAECGYTYHSMTHDVVDGGQDVAEVELSGGQFALNVGLSLSF